MALFHGATAKPGIGWTGPQATLEIEQLAHEPEVGGDVGFSLLDVLVCALHSVVVVFHEVGQDDGD